MKVATLGFPLETSFLHSGNLNVTRNHRLQGKMQHSLKPHYRPVMVQTANTGNPPLLNPETAALQYQEDFPINTKVSLSQLPEARDRRSRSTRYKEPLTTH